MERGAIDRNWTNNGRNRAVRACPTADTDVARNSRLRAYLDFAGHGADHDGPIFWPLRGNAAPHDPAGQIVPNTIDLVVRKFAKQICLARGYSSHSMRAAFITTALENGAQLEDVQQAAGHRDPSTTKLYDRRGYNPEKAASFFATC